jgi:large subunit ribosomal protein L24
MRIRKDDTVVVITGDDAGGKSATIARVLRVLADEGRVIVEGVNRAYKHLRRSRRNPQGGRLSKEMPVDVSNVMLYCQQCKRGVRAGARYGADGHKERFCKKCGAALGALSKPRKAHAKKA